MNILFFLHPKSSVTYLTMGNSLRQGSEKMRASGDTEIPVIDKEGNYAGTVRQGDFLWKIIDSGSADLHRAEDVHIDGIVSRRIAPVSVNTTMDELLAKAIDQNFVPVVDDRGSFVATALVNRSLQPGVLFMAETTYTRYYKEGFLQNVTNSARLERGYSMFFGPQIPYNDVLVEVEKA